MRWLDGKGNGFKIFEAKVQILINTFTTKTFHVVYGACQWLTMLYK